MTKEQKILLIKKLQEAVKENEYGNCILLIDFTNIVSNVLLSKDALIIKKEQTKGYYRNTYIEIQIISDEEMKIVYDEKVNLLNKGCVEITKNGAIKITNKILNFGGNKK